MRHTNPTDTPAELVEAWALKLQPDQSANAWDVAREMGIPPLSAESALENLVKKGRLTNGGRLIKEGNYYSVIVQDDGGER